MSIGAYYIRIDAGGISLTPSIAILTLPSAWVQGALLRPRFFYAPNVGIPPVGSATTKVVPFPASVSTRIWP